MSRGECIRGVGPSSAWLVGVDGRRLASREEMAAMFLAADVMLVTPLRDGMNLVAKEYVA
jgi:hypothetical protein